MTGYVSTGPMGSALICPARSSRARGPVARKRSQTHPDIPDTEIGHASTVRSLQGEVDQLTLVMRRFALFIGLTLGLSTGLMVRADQPLPFAQTKAANLARMRAESINGGLGAYRAAGCMYETGGTSCLASKTSGGFLFRFEGGPPGWEQQTPPRPSLETSVLVSKDGDRILEVPYNGPLR